MTEDEEVNYSNKIAPNEEKGMHGSTQVHFWKKKQGDKHSLCRDAARQGKKGSI